MFTFLKSLNTKVVAIATQAIQTFTNQANKPSNPPTNTLYLYSKNNNLYQLDENGVESSVGSVSAAPVGSIVAYYGSTIPAGWLLCNGGTFDQTLYSALYVLLGNSNILPDLRGQFLRGKNNGRTDGKQDLDGERNIGSYQVDDFKSHYHKTLDQNYSRYYNLTGVGSSVGFNGAGDPGNTGTTGGTETRPKNIAINWIINASSAGGSNNQSNNSLSSFSIGDYKYSTQNANHNNWILCNGSAISRTTYSNLFAIIGTAFGIGDGSTTFNVPDFRGNVPGGIGQGQGLTNRTMGSKIGEENHILTISEMPSHNHHLSKQLRTSQSSGSTPYIWYDADPVYYDVTNCNNGGGLSHNNMQPTIFAGNWFIYFA